MVNIRGVPSSTSFFYILNPSLCNVDQNGAALGPDCPSVSDSNDVPVLGLHLRYGMRTKAHLHYGPTDAGSIGKNRQQDPKQDSQYCCVLQLGELHDKTTRKLRGVQRLGQNCYG